MPQMNIVPLEFSIVVVGQNCNPTILNPDFLKYRGIVPEEWGWELAAAPITTQPISVVSYNSDVTIKVETNRFQVADRRHVANVVQSKAIEIATRYIEELPHVKYTAVGINFRRIVEIDEPDNFLKVHFLKNHRWNQNNNPLLGVSLKFAYLHGAARLNLSLEGGRVERTKEEALERIQGILAHGNYHRDCHGYPSDREVVRYIGEAESDEQHFGSFLTELLSSPQDELS